MEEMEWNINRRDWKKGRGLMRIISFFLACIIN